MSTFKKKIAAIVSSLIMAAGYSLIDYYLIPDDEIEPQTEQIDELQSDSILTDTITIQE